MDKKDKMISNALVILIIIGLLMSGLSLFVNFAKEPIKGKDGKDGIGIKGKDGKDGHTPILGIDYFVHNGTDGKDGVSIVGARGSDGMDGKDCPPNKTPKVTLNNLSYCNNSKPPYILKINITVDDPENDAMHVNFYYKVKLTNKWVLVDEFIGYDDTYKSTVSLSCFYKSVYFLVEVWDGSDIGLYNFTWVYDET